MTPKAFLSVAIVTACITAWPGDLEAQRNCRKGIPCGNSCISRDKVCRIGSGSSETSPTPSAVPLSGDEGFRTFVTPSQASEHAPAAGEAAEVWEVGHALPVRSCALILAVGPPARI